VARDDNTGAQPAASGGPWTAGEKERSRLVVAGQRTDNAQRCTLVVVGEVAGTWACYPHGAAQLGVRLPHSEAVRVAHQILDGARWDHPRQHERTALGWSTRGYRAVGWDLLRSGPSHCWVSGRGVRPAGLEWAGQCR